jgi:transposase
VDGTLSEAWADQILQEMSPQLSKLYCDIVRPSIAPERWLRALLLQIFYSVRSERLLIEQLDYNLRFRWFVGMSMDEDVGATPAERNSAPLRASAADPGS